MSKSERAAMLEPFPGAARKLLDYCAVARKQHELPKSAAASDGNLA
jgi:hypothetical protein